MRRKLIVIVGPTASGKSELAVKLALRLRTKQSRTKLGIGGAEIVSADSRQVYKGLDIGSGKVPRDKGSGYRVQGMGRGTQKAKPYFHQGVPHHLLDVAHPRRTYTVAHYQRDARRALESIWRRGNTPILCGGTGFYIQAVVDGIVIPNVKPNRKLRHALEQRTNEQLYDELKRKDPARAKTIDRHNKRRLIRALEIVEARGTVPPRAARPLNADVLIIGIKKNPSELAALIRTRLLERLKRGMITEVKNLHVSGLSWRRLEGFGLEYRHVARFLQGKDSREEMVEALVRDIVAFAKRQMTWFRHHGRTVWLTRAPEVYELTHLFLRK